MRLSSGDVRVVAVSRAVWDSVLIKDHTQHSVTPHQLIFPACLPHGAILKQRPAIV